MKKILLPIIIIALAVFGFSSLKNSKPEPPVATKKEKVWRVNTVNVEFQRLTPELTLYGRVETPRKAQLTAAVEADVVESSVFEGMSVQKGDLLVKLDDIDIQLEIAQREADLAEIQASIQSEHNRYKTDKDKLKNQQELYHLADKAVARAQVLESSNLTSQSALDDAISNAHQQQLALKQLQYELSQHSSRLAQLEAQKKRVLSLIEQSKVNLSRTEIKAPFDGRVASLSVSVGDRVRTGSPLVTLYDLSKLEVRAQLPGKYLHEIYAMFDMAMKPEATAVVNNTPMVFQLERLSGEVQQDSGGIDGLFGLKQKNTQLPLGTFVELTFNMAPQDNTIAIPYNAIYGLDHVYVNDEGYLKSVDIEQIGEFTNEQGDKTLIIRSADLKQGDQIVSTQLPNAMTGLRVETAHD
jgi:RND family efflux transporter MFP subunit